MPGSILKVTSRPATKHSREGSGNRISMPNFFIIGAQKAGTTSLYRYLDQHPEIYFSPFNEPRFFAREINPDGEVVVQRFGGPSRRQPPRLANLDAYRALFRGVEGERAIGEASPTYIYAPGTAERIKKYVPGARAIALLRNPADRAYSPTCMPSRLGRSRLRTSPKRSRERKTAYATTGATSSITATGGSTTGSSSVTSKRSDGKTLGSGYTKT